MTALLTRLLRFYRFAVSPAVGPVCRFHPSCSVYAEDALVTHGLLRGVGLTLWRLLRCHPFSRGGLDPVPPPRIAPAIRAEAGVTPAGGGPRIAPAAEESA